MIGFLLVVGLLAGGIFMAQRDPGFTRKIPSPLLGKPLPDFSLPELRDPTKSVSPAQFKGRVWLLNVWGSWCPECWREHRYLEQLAETQQLTIVGLNWRDDRTDALEMLQQAGNPYVAIGVDPDSDAAVDLGVYGAPESFLIDKLGIVRLKHVGALNPEVWRVQFLPLMSRLRSES
jgi:cytochrome c biogenesis protein CcmG/thiol:disulfide interchange protein DsbE